MDDVYDNDQKRVPPVTVTLTELNPKITLKPSTSYMTTETIGLDSHSKRLSSNESIGSNQSLVLQCQQIARTSIPSADRCIPLPLYTNIDSTKSQTKTITNTSGPTLAFIRSVLSFHLILK